MRSMVRAGLAALALAATATAALAWLRKDLATPADFASAAYVKSGSCRRCHPDRHASWARTYHRTMTQSATPAAVVGDFDDARFVFDGVESRFFRRGDSFRIETLGPDGARGEFEVALTVGSRRFQQYVTKIGDRHVRLPLAWNIEERRWFHLNGGFLTPDGAGFSTHAAVWDGNCIFCHNVKGNPGYDFDAATFASRVEEHGIACEACHAPGGEHASRNANPLRRYLLHYGDGHDATIVNPRRLDPVRSTQVCGRCHGQRLPEPLERTTQFMTQGDPFVPGQDLSRFTRPILRGSRLGDVDFSLRFWPDGTPRLTAYEYQGLLLSKGHQGTKLTCLSCHAAHAGDPRGMIEPGMRGARGCTQCHEAIASDVRAHTRHDPAGSGSDCYACHMPRITYGLLETHPSHRIENPEPARAWRDGRPDACTLCHLDRSATWAARESSRLFGRALPSDLPASPEFALAESVRMLAGGDVVQRAVVLRALSRPQAASGTARARRWAVPLFVEALEDDYAAIRHFAWRGLRELLGQDGVLEPAERTRWAAQPSFDPQASAAERARAIASYRSYWHGLDKDGLTRDVGPLGLDHEYEVARSVWQPLAARRDTRLVSIGE